jgi:NAD(P)-dependent dehydrogenase (short-subunit alcohol dehydrogenase family)
MLTAIVTGANSGLGLSCATELSARGWHVVLACRDAARGEAARQKMRGAAEVAQLDTSDLGSVRAFVDHLHRSTRPPLGALVCNAGVQANGPTTWTRAGLETTFATNHLGHFALSRLLVPDLVGGQIVFVASGTHDPKQWTGMPAPKLDDVRAFAFGRSPEEDEGRAARRRYSTSKLCNVLCAYELDRRLRAANLSIRVNAFDPGLMPGTDLARDYGALARVAWRYLLPLFTVLVPNVNRVQTSARRMVELVEHGDGTSGKYYSRGRITRSSAQSYDERLARALWDVSSELAGLPAALG